MNDKTVRIMEISHRIRKVREWRNISQMELAERLSITQQAIHKYENGKVDLSAVVLEDIAQALQVSPIYLAGWSEDSIDWESMEKEKLQIEALEEVALSDIDLQKIADYIRKVSDRRIEKAKKERSRLV